MELHAGWKLQAFEPGGGLAVQAHHPHYDDSHWMPAVVPGDVASSLAAAEQIADPYAADELQWIEEKEWWFRTSFSIDAADVPEHVELLFEGLATFAAVYLNGIETGHSRNAFLPARFDISGRLATDQPNHIAIRFDPPSAGVPADAPQQHALHDAQRVWIRQPAIDFGWTFAPRRVVIGVIDPVHLIARQKSRIRTAACTTTAITGQQADIVLRAEVDAPREHGPMVVEFTLSDDETQYKVLATVDAYGIAEAEMNIPRARLWWTHDLGEPYLYTLGACLFAGGEKTDDYERQVGLRTIQLLQDPVDGGKSFRFRLNNFDLFCRGANWLPADCIPAHRSFERYRTLILAAVDANMNMLRVWGGGRYESESFYDLCDQQGVLVWQDFMFAAAEYPVWDTEFADNCRAEAEHIVRRLRHHACIALWCGNDECQWRFGESKTPEGTSGAWLFEEIMPEICNRLAPEIPFLPGSPFGGSDPNSPAEGDFHDYGVWQRLTDDAPEPSASFVSSAGAVELPPQTEKTSKAFAGALGGAHHDLPALLCHAEGLKKAAEHCRRIKSQCGGILLWHFNACRPGMRLGLIDHSLFRTPAYHYARRFFRPVVASVRELPEEIEVWISNDRASEFIEPVKVALLDCAGAERWNLQLETAVEQWQSQPILTIKKNELPKIDAARTILAVTSSTDADLRCVHYFAPPARLDLARAEVRVEVENFRNIMARVTVSCKELVRCFSIHLPDLPLEISDNYFDLLPGEQRVVHIRPRREFDPKRLSFKALNAAPIVEYVR